MTHRRLVLALKYAYIWSSAMRVLMVAPTCRFSRRDTVW